MEDSEKTETIENKEESTQEPEKQTNRVFSQSETDKAVADAIRKEREKFGDYESVINENKAIKENQKKALESDISELQKVQAKLLEIEEAKALADTELFNYKKESKINTVLADAKFKDLPKVYRNLVTYSDDLDEISQSADAALETYKSDFGGQVKTSFGIPDTDNQKKTISALGLNTNDGRNSIKAHINERLKNRM